MRDLETSQVPRQQVVDLGLSSSLLCRMRDYWKDLKADRVIPFYDTFDYVDLLDALPHTVMVDVHYHPTRFQLRFIGTFITDVAQRDSTGQWIDEDLYPDNLPDIIWTYRYCLDHTGPLATCAPVDFVAKEWKQVEWIFLPFTVDGSSVSQVLSGMDTSKYGTQIDFAKGDAILNFDR